MNKENPHLRNSHLDGSSFYWPKGDVAVLCLHGFTATTVEVRKMAEFLSQQGYTVKAPLLPGHGTSPVEMNKTGWRDWYGVAENSLKELQKNYSRIFVLGESMGGLLTLHLAAKYPHLCGVLLFAPAVRISRLWLAKILWPFVPVMQKKPADNQLPQQSYDAFPLKAAASLFDLQRIVRSELPDISTPIMIFQGRHDDTIDAMGAVYAHKQIGSVDKELVILNESCHLILLDKQMPQVQEMTNEFIVRILSGLA